MHIFLDESGSFVGYERGSIGVVGALVIPDGNLRDSVESSQGYVLAF